MPKWMIIAFAWVGVVSLIWWAYDFIDWLIYKHQEKKRLKEISEWLGKWGA